ncbi:uncharacterized protein EAF01_002827 [Botrytis porri]|uniref:Uncharacterized protein n=1 Tax=Botrytis porri TaxID=87229 RepID=A0A4Z1KWU4_9HELO|nr:uncharacterized protein EAF01_002827 [Botrytis porri]KAF7911320.1 hypothetical protein EAF01_002827 [Botrytis porri]TGO89035.1 hypothetical protein BPOR_0128g00090 [Botrytis porri]
MNETRRTDSTRRDRINERVHIALEWAEDVDGLERGLEGFGLDDELERWMALRFAEKKERKREREKERKKASYESPRNSLLTRYCAASGMDAENAND